MECSAQCILRTPGICSCFVNCMQNKITNIKTANKSSASVAKFKYLTVMLAIEKCMHEEIKSRLYPENASYHPGDRIFRLPVYNIKMQRFKYRENQAHEGSWLPSNILIYKKNARTIHTLMITQLRDLCPCLSTNSDAAFNLSHIVSDVLLCRHICSCQQQSVS